MAKSSDSKNRFWGSIQGQIIFVLLVSIIPSLLIMAHIFSQWYKTGHENELEANLQIARAVAKTFDGFVEDVLHQEYAIGHALTMGKMSAEERKQFIDINIAEYLSFLNLLWISPEGIIRDSHLRSVEGQSASDWTHIQEIIAGRKWAGWHQT